MVRSTALLLAVILTGCSGGAEGPPPESDGGVDAPVTPMTWTELYGTYFGPSTPGHCGQSSACHQMSQGGFTCGTTADSCYKGMVAAFLIDPTHPTMSAIADPNQSPLVWFGGNMPRDNLASNAQAKIDVAAWVAAGAQEN
jgi:hypothetical protein